MVPSTDRERQIQAGRIMVGSLLLYSTGSVVSVIYSSNHIEPLVRTTTTSGYHAEEWAQLNPCLGEFARII